MRVQLVKMMPNNFPKWLCYFTPLPAIDPQLDLVKLLNFAKLIGIESHLLKSWFAFLSFLMK